MLHTQTEQAAHEAAMKAARKAWGTRTLDEALDREFLHVGPHGAHDLTDAGRKALRNAR